MKRAKKSLSMGRRNYFSMFGVFSASLLLTASVIYMYSPVFKSNAADSSADVNVDINPIISLSLDTNALNFSMTPTSAGVFDSKPITATVDTNSTGGYELYFSSIDDQTSMTSLTSESTVTSTFADTVTSTTMPNNTWGYSLDNTDFSKIPTLTNHVAIKNLDHLPSAAEKATTTNIGIKIDDTLASGTYNKKVLFSAVAHPSKNPSISTITTMQQMTTEVCDASAVNEVATLTDIRDGEVYNVGKLIDGNCWLLDNLRLDPNTLTTTLSPENTNMSPSVAFTLPSSIGGFNSNTSPNINTDRKNVEMTYGDSTNITKVGVYYNYCAAKAGTYCYPENDTGIVTSYDICPKGWRLPTGGGGEYYSLYLLYESDHIAFKNALHLPLAGSIATSGYTNSKVGRFWAADGSGPRFMNACYTAETYASPGSSALRTSGFNVRCVAK